MDGRAWNKAGRYKGRGGENRGKMRGMRDKRCKISLHKMWQNSMYDLLLDYAGNMQGMYNREANEGAKRALFLNEVLFWER